MRTFHSDLWIGLCLSLFAGFVLWAVRVGIGPFDYEASILPGIGAGSLLMFSAALMASSFGDAKARDSSADDHEAPLDGLRLLRLAVAAGLVGLHAMLLESFGIVLVGLSLQFSLYLMLGRRLLPAAVTSGLTVAVLYVVIDMLLGIPLPKGDLW
tara:strand:- start:2379 stop:2843 length:465 start_codon:yes stop_codon:yes gene_type:complete